VQNLLLSLRKSNAKELELKEKRKMEREAKKALQEEERKCKAQLREEKKAQKQKMLDQRKDMQRRGSSRAPHQVHDSPETGIQHRELSENECAVCFGLHEEDSEPVEWLKCTNEDCNVWSHTNCLEVCDGAYVCYACGTLLI